MLEAAQVAGEREHRLVGVRAAGARLWRARSLDAQICGHTQRRAGSEQASTPGALGSWQSRERWACSHPVVQGRHSVWPRLGMNLPASHRLHVPAPGAAATAPGRHSLQALALEEPGTGLALPTGHAMHAVLLLEPRSGLYEPFGHC